MLEMTMTDRISTEKYVYVVASLNLWNTRWPNV
jgi:hypothetical protein